MVYLEQATAQFTTLPLELNGLAQTSKVSVEYTVLIPNTTGPCTKHEVSMQKLKELNYEVQHMALDLIQKPKIFQQLHPNLDDNELNKTLNLCKVKKVSHDAQCVFCSTHLNQPQ